MNEPQNLMDPVVIYSTTWCPDCRRAKNFLKDRGVQFREINIEEDPDAEDLVLRVNHGRRKVPPSRTASTSSLAAHSIPLSWRTN